MINIRYTLFSVLSIPTRKNTCTRMIDIASCWWTSTLSFRKLQWQVHCEFKSVSHWSLTPNEHLWSYIVARTSYIRWDDVCFVLDQHALLDLYSASFNLRNSPRVDMSLHSDTLSRFRYSVIVLLRNATCLAEKQHILILWSLWSNPWTSALKAKTLTINTPMRLRI